MSFETAYRKTESEIKNRFPNHPFRAWAQDYRLPQYPNRTCTREMKERTISRYLSSIGVMPRHCVRCVGIRFDELGKREPQENQYYELILQGITKKKVNNHFEFEMPFRLETPSWLGNCGACISKSIRSLCTVARHRPEKFDFFKVLAEDLGFASHTYYRDKTSITKIFEMAPDNNIIDAHDNRFDTELQYEFVFDLDSEGACGGTCEPFS